MLIPVFIPKTKRDWKNIAVFVAAAVIIGCGIITSNSIKDLKNDYQISESFNISPEEMINSSDIYAFKNAVVFDYYATTEYDSSSPTSYHFLIGYHQNDTDIRMASVTLNANDGEIFEKMLSYGDNREAAVGECIVDIYATAQSIDSIDEELIDYYNQSVDYYTGYYDEITSSGLKLDYCFDSIDDYESYVADKKSAAEGGIIVSGIGVVIAVILLILGLIKRGPTKKQLEKARRKLAEEAQQNSGDPFAQYRQNDTYYNQNNNVDSQGYYVPPQEQNGYYNSNSDNHRV